MNNNAVNDPTNQPVNLNAEYTPDTTTFTAAAAAPTGSAPTAATTSAIAPDDYLPSSGLKMDTELFSKGNIKNMADKYTTGTTPDYDAPNADNPDAYAQDYGFTDSNSPYSLRNRKFTPYYTDTTTPPTSKKEEKNYDKVTIDTTPSPDSPGDDTPNTST